MSLHVFGNFVTPLGTAANNRGETDGNITTLQKIVWQGQVHSTVSAEAIRFALRLRLAEDGGGATNRSWDEGARCNAWQDPEFKGWKSAKGDTYADDDLLGFMRADAAKEEGGAGSTTARRSPLEISRAISLTPWPGDVTFNAAAPGATPSAQKKGSNPVPYGTEVHATRYQFGFALTPERLRVTARAEAALRALVSLRKVAGNHGRFLFDFSPESLVLRVTDDPAPRLLYCFETRDGGRTVEAPELVRRVEAGDIGGKELFVGGAIAGGETGQRLKAKGASVEAGVKAALGAALATISARQAKK
ncbi:MAG TPA: type I-B CRISPR-associated protein Cas7/Cst2/DevR [Verrucomicrobiae bacterium]|nr:type I-B CRISPR-associated protein Cas7/Cst2/DevR [Verrucomicrobiae bacterium]